MTRRRGSRRSLAVFAAKNLRARERGEDTATCGRRSFPSTYAYSAIRIRDFLTASDAAVLRFLFSRRFIAESLRRGSPASGLVPRFSPPSPLSPFASLSSFSVHVLQVRPCPARRKKAEPAIKRRFTAYVCVGTPEISICTSWTRLGDG